MALLLSFCLESKYNARDWKKVTSRQRWCCQNAGLPCFSAISLSSCTHTELLIARLMVHEKKKYSFFFFLSLYCSFMMGELSRIFSLFLLGVKNFFLFDCIGFSCSTTDLCFVMWGLLLWLTGFSLVVAHRLNCFTACGILVPRPGIEPAFPCAATWILTPGPPGKSSLSEMFITPSWV